MGLRKSAKAREIEGLMSEGKKPSDIIAERPDLAEGFNELVKVKERRGGTPRGSGPARSGPEFSGHVSDLEQPSF